jgi:hypothetical protein
VLAHQHGMPAVGNRQPFLPAKWHAGERRTDQSSGELIQWQLGGQQVLMELGRIVSESPHGQLLLAIKENSRLFPVFRGTKEINSSACPVPYHLDR